MSVRNIIYIINQLIWLWLTVLFVFCAEQVVGINSREQKVKLDDGAEIGYDKLLLAPGWYLDLLKD